MMFRIVGLVTLALIIGAVFGLWQTERYITTPHAFTGQDGNRYMVVNGEISGPLDL